MEKIKVKAPAKINLYLNVAGKKENGYHDIESVMQSVSLYDTVEIYKRETKDAARIYLRGDGVKVPLDGRNLVHKAAVAFFEEAGIPTYDVTFCLHKKIPTQAGLGGGSSDAAAVLQGLNALYKTGFSEEKLREMGAKLGADIPFCLMRGTATAEGIGEILQPLQDMPDCTVLIAMPRGGKVSTAEAYRQIDSLSGGPDVSYTDFLSALQTGKIEEVSSHLYNIFEKVIPESAGSLALIEKMKELGAIGSRMSGSGAAVFGIFKTREEAKWAFDKLPERMRKHICYPISRKVAIFTQRIFTRSGKPRVKKAENKTE